MPCVKDAPNNNVRPPELHSHAKPVQYPCLLSCSNLHLPPFEEQWEWPRLQTSDTQEATTDFGLFLTLAIDYCFIIGPDASIRFRIYL
jgi:hypothetical protein